MKSLVGRAVGKGLPLHEDDLLAEEPRSGSPTYAHSALVRTSTSIASATSFSAVNASDGATLPA